MARTVLDTARLLQATAGYDGIDDRQLGAPRPDNLPPYVDLVLESRQTGVRGLRIGILKEAFHSHHLAPSVKGLVRQAIQRFVDMGAEVKEVSVPT
jgi:amidase